MDPTTLDRPIPSGGAAVHTPATPSPASPPVPAPQAPAPVSAPVVLSREALFGDRPIKTVDVEIPGLGIARVSSLTQGAWEDLNNRHEGEDGKTNTSKGYMSEAVASALVGPDGRYMFADHVEGGKHVRALGLQVVTALFGAVAVESGLTAGAREALGKDSGPTHSDAG